jgi:hypothetical protein
MSAARWLVPVRALSQSRPFSVRPMLGAGKHY